MVDQNEIRCWIGMGSNLGERADWMRRARVMLDDAVGVRVVRSSALYETAPMYVTDQPSFLNAVLEIETTLSAHALLHALLAVEAALGRQRVERNGPRNIDLDLLQYGDEVIETASLSVPHPRLHERRFVLVPLVELAPTQYCPGTNETFAALLERCTDPDRPRKWSDSTWVAKRG